LPLGISAQGGCILPRSIARLVPFNRAIRWQIIGSLLLGLRLVPLVCLSQSIACISIGFGPSRCIQAAALAAQNRCDLLPKIPIAHETEDPGAAPIRPTLQGMQHRTSKIWSAGPMPWSTHCIISIRSTSSALSRGRQSTRPVQT
jgi:hypothetical protein